MGTHSTHFNTDASQLAADSMQSAMAREYEIGVNRLTPSRRAQFTPATFDLADAAIVAVAASASFDGGDDGGSSSSD